MSVADLFVTGMARSGTTLLEKMLASHPRISLLSQPFPHLFVHAKRRFIESLGLAQPLHPLGHLFQNECYRDSELASFLTGLTLSAARLRQIFEQMADYSGQWTRPHDLDCVLEGLDRLGFAATIRALDRRMAHRERADGYGSKEIRCEEFVPHLLSEGFHCLVVIRDPRDVIASMNFGQGERFVGASRPVLFDLRMWRKSVAYALQHADHPRFHWMRYEDLVSAPADEASRLAAWLGLEPYPVSMFSQGLRDQSGRPWQGNSSYAGQTAIHADSVGAYRRCLDADWLRYIETVCFPEMRRLGYKLGLDEPDLDHLGAFRERIALRTDDLPADYSSRADNVEAERARLRAWQQPAPDGAGCASFFHFARVARILREGLGGGDGLEGDEECRSVDGSASDP
jgi:hypothetical protein